MDILKEVIIKEKSPFFILNKPKIYLNYIILLTKIMIINIPQILIFYDKIYNRNFQNIHMSTT